MLFQASINSILRPGSTKKADLPLESQQPAENSIFNLQLF